MAGNGRVGSSRGGAASISAAAVAVGSVQERFPTLERRSRWMSCFDGFSCFGSQKGGKRIVPAARIPDGNASTGRGNMAQPVGPSNQNTNLNLSLLAPPSSPASFTNSALPSTVQSPNCFLSMSANSPGGPSSTMFTTGPYAHETQLVSPPVFSTYTTEPSTAPLTPPPELAHLTTPSSPDVPFARLLSSSLTLKNTGQLNGIAYSGFVCGELQTNYQFYPGSPTSSLISPVSVTPRNGLSSPYPECDIPTQWGASVAACGLPPRNGRAKLLGLDSSSSRNLIMSTDPSFFHPEFSAQFYLDHAQQSSVSYSHSGARLSVSREGESYPNGCNRQNKPSRQDPEEIEAYRASFGFSADEIVATPHYVEINDGVDVSFAMPPFSNCKSYTEQHPFFGLSAGGQKSFMVDPGSPKMSNLAFKGELALASNHGDSITGGEKANCHGNSVHSAESCEATFSKSKSRRMRLVESCSDAEIEYRRARSIKEAKNMLAMRSSPS
ncbi:hypothetical protein HPP92_019110 [Vanilla planifolia]|uniref:Hydroxyproline-rich glycoprotein family protein n=1 Tax=Vanilla planifolia TaxID=51239 RepID=A0A835Q2A9_VANPL|nr:hypothetical protein HPP92_019110 [Vanilla planifolia]